MPREDECDECYWHCRKGHWEDAAEYDEKHCSDYTVPRED
jgi:hypothetical protein